MCGGGGGGGGDGRRIRILPLVFMFQKYFKLGAFTPEMPITLSFLDSVLYEIQNKETKKKKKKRERKRKEKSTLLGTSYPIKGYFPLIGLYGQ